MAIIQFRVEDSLKSAATAVYEKIGIDLSTALRIFLKRSVQMNGIPFPMILPGKRDDASSAIEALRKMQEISEANGNSEMTLDEINEEIRLARLERREREKKKDK